MQNLMLEGFRAMEIRPTTQRYYGKSSALIFMRETFKAKFESRLDIPMLPPGWDEPRARGLRRGAYSHHPVCRVSVNTQSNSS